MEKFGAVEILRGEFLELLSEAQKKAVQLF